jgi:hypothetical protein
MYCMLQRTRTLWAWPRHAPDVCWRMLTHANVYRSLTLCGHGHVVLLSLGAPAARGVWVGVRGGMLTYADVCWHVMLLSLGAPAPYADVCWHMLTYTDVSWQDGLFDGWTVDKDSRFPTYPHADVCWRMLTYELFVCWQDGLSDGWTVDMDARFPTYPGWFPDP